MCFFPIPLLSSFNYFWSFSSIGEERTLVTLDGETDCKSS